LPDLYYSLLALALIVLIRTLPLKRLPRPRTIFDKVVRTPAVETAISAASLLKLLIFGLGPNCCGCCEGREVYTLLAVEAGGKRICQVEHSVVAL
jgi:hypothetical protein